MIELVVTDLDDTLVARNKLIASKRCLHSIHQMLNAGVVCGPATGRDISHVGYLYRFDKACYQTAIVANGMRVYYNGEGVLTKELDREGMRKADDVVSRDERACILAYQADNRSWASGTTVDEMVEHHMGHLRNCSGVDRYNPDTFSLVKANVQFDGPLEDQNELMEALQQACPELSFSCPVGGIIDITAHGWDKGEAALWLAHYLGIADAEIAAFGDAGNDYQMIKKVPNSVAVANAFDEIIDTARWHIGFAEDDAVATAFEDIAQAAQEQRMPKFMSTEENEKYLKLAHQIKTVVPSVRCRDKQ